MYSNYSIVYICRTAAQYLRPHYIFVERNRHFVLKRIFALTNDALDLLT